MKVFFRLGLGGEARIYSAEEIVRKYKDAATIMYKAGQTNGYLNAYAGAVYTFNLLIGRPTTCR